MTALAMVVHWTHVLAGIAWFGSQIFVFLALWPTLLARPVGEAGPLLGALMPRVGRLFAPVVPTVVLTGILRATAFGPIRSLGALATPYGATFAASLLLVIALSMNGARMRARMRERVFGAGAFPDGARAFLRVHGAIALTGLALLLACMVLMRFGV